MPEPGWVTVATVDEVHLEVLREVLADAGIAVHFEPVRREQQLDLPPIVSRPMVEVEVEEPRRAEAEALLAEFSKSGADAAEAEAETATGDGGAEPRPTASLWRRAVRWITGDTSDFIDPRPPGDKDHGPHS